MKNATRETAVVEYSAAAIKVLHFAFEPGRLLLDLYPVCYVFADRRRCRTNHGNCVLSVRLSHHEKVAC